MFSYIKALWDILGFLLFMAQTDPEWLMSYAKYLREAW